MDDLLPNRERNSPPKATSRRTWPALVAILTLLTSLVVIAAPTPASAAENPEHIAFTLEGCRGDASNFPATGPFVCSDADYTTGNLGKGWNELDLVPHRLTTSAGTQDGVTTTYTMAIVADASRGGAPGYDWISVPVAQTSDCLISAGDLLTATPGFGGADSSIYRIVTITQPAGSTCEFDYYQRLALGSSAFTGSSLQSNLANQELGSQGIGQKRVSIPDTPAPQTIEKDMTASQGSDHVWTVTKSATPATLKFGDTCAAGAAASLPVAITITWTKQAATPTGPVTIVTHVYANNPAHRPINISVTDDIYAGSTPTGAVLDTATVSATVPADTNNHLVLTHTAVVASGPTSFNDVATATYTDPVAGLPAINLTRSDTAVATVQQGGTTTNQSATITDTESITGDGLTFSVATPSVGAFTGGYAGTPTMGPVGWSSGSQTGSGSVTFNKTVYLDQPRATSGTLSDTATLTGSDGFSTATGPLDVGISSTATVALTINKTIPNVLSGTETAAFTMQVSPGATFDPNNIVASPVITFTAGETADSAVIIGLAPGTYTVHEVDDGPGGWVPQNDQSTTITLPSCNGEVAFSNSFVNVRILTTPSGLNESDNSNTPTPEDPHTITATVQVQDGSAAWVAAPTGTIVTFTVTGVGGFVGGTNTTTCATSADGTCTVQLNSSAVGTSTVSATATPEVDSVTVTGTTGTAINTAQGGSENVVKKWANASIVVVEDDINAVGDNHTFTITVTPDAPDDATVANVSITPSVSPSATVETNTCSSGVAVTAAGTYACEYTINSSSAGVFDVDATTVVDFAWEEFGLRVNRSTAAGQYAGPSGDQGAAKTYVDARVAVGDDAVNQVGQAHTVTGHAEFHDGSPAGDAGWQDAEDETITFTITEGPGAFSNGASTITCQSGSDGTCSVTMVSSTPGVTWVSASTNYDVPNGGVVLFRSTATDGSKTSNDLRKEWVSATISITPDAVNEVGDEHVFTITVTATGPPATITIENITYDVDPAGTTDDLVCAAAQATSTGKTRTCTLTIQSDIADVFTANASAQVTMEGLGEPIDLTTNATNGNSGAAVKTFVDARITITPDGVNEVGQPHTVTALVEVNDGTNGWLPLAGASVQLTEDGPGTIAAICGPTASNGTCAVDLTSTAPGVSVVHGRVELTVLGEPVTRDTDTAINTAAGGSGDLTKRWVDAFIAIAPLTAENPLNQAHVFTVTVTATTSGASPLSFDAITTSVAPSPGAMSSTCQTPTVSGNTATCSITINSATAGRFVANATATVTIGATTITRSTDESVAPFGPGGSGPATKEYVDAVVLGAVVSRPPAVQAGAPLPATGGDVRHPILIGFVLLALGAVLLAAGRTRSHALATRPSRKSE